MNQEVSKEVIVLYKEDLCREDVQNCIRTVKEKNEMLGVSIEQYLKADNGKGIRHDVLIFFMEYIEVISTELEVIYTFVSLFGNIDLYPSWYEWINMYCKKNTFFKIDDFVTLLQEALEKNIPLRKVKEVFLAGKDDMFKIYENIESYVEEDGSDEDADMDKESSHFIHMAAGGKSEVVDKCREKGVNYTGMLGDLLEVVTEKRGNIPELAPVQEHLNGYAASLQNFVIDITKFSGQIVSEWQSDREENARLKSLYRMQQKLIESQQDKIMEMREEVFRLNGLIQNYEKADIHRAAMNRKIDELHSLSGQDSFFGGFVHDKY